MFGHGVGACGLLSERSGFLGVGRARAMGGEGGIWNVFISVGCRLLVLRYLRVEVCSCVNFLESLQ